MYDTDPLSELTADIIDDRKFVIDEPYTIECCSLRERLDTLCLASRVRDNLYIRSVEIKAQLCHLFHLKVSVSLADDTTRDRFLLTQRSEAHLRIWIELKALFKKVL